MTDIVERLRENADLDAAEHVPADVVNMQYEAANEIERLRNWIREEGVQTDTCTFNVLGKICDECRCGKIKTPNVIAKRATPEKD